MKVLLEIGLTKLKVVNPVGVQLHSSPAPGQSPGHPLPMPDNNVSKTIITDTVKAIGWFGKFDLVFNLRICL